MFFLLVWLFFAFPSRLLFLFFLLAVFSYVTLLHFLFVCRCDTSFSRSRSYLRNGDGRSNEWGWKINRKKKKLLTVVIVVLIFSTSLHSRVSSPAHFHRARRDVDFLIAGSDWLFRKSLCFTISPLYRWLGTLNRKFSCFIHRYFQSCTRVFSILHFASTWEREWNEERRKMKENKSVFMLNRLREETI